MFALVLDGEIQAVQGRLPGAARIVATGEWLMPPKREWTTEQAESCGWFVVVDSPPTFDDATEVLERGDVALVDGVPTVAYTVRAKTADELAAEAEATANESEREQARRAVDQLTAYIQLPSPTAAQTRDAVQLLARVCRRLIRDSYGPGSS